MTIKPEMINQSGNQRKLLEWRSCFEVTSRTVK